MAVSLRKIRFPLDNARRFKTFKSGGCRKVGKGKDEAQERLPGGSPDRWRIQTGANLSNQGFPYRAEARAPATLTC